MFRCPKLVPQHNGWLPFAPNWHLFPPFCIFSVFWWKTQLKEICNGNNHSCFLVLRDLQWKGFFFSGSFSLVKVHWKTFETLRKCLITNREFYRRPHGLSINKYTNTKTRIHKCKITRIQKYTSAQIHRAFCRSRHCFLISCHKSCGDQRAPAA